MRIAIARGTLTKEEQLELGKLPAVWARILGVMQEGGAEAGQDAAAPVLQPAT